MQKLAGVWLAGISLCVTSVLNAQGPPEKVRIVCDVQDPQSKCPGADCLCTDDTFEITFDGVSDSVFEYERFIVDLPISTEVICDAKSTKPNPAPPPDVVGAVWGWSFGVDHDDAFLTLTSVSVMGTESEIADSGNGFAVYDMVDIETCREDPDPLCSNPEPGTGYIHAVILSFGQPLVLEPRRNVIVKADYTLKADPGRDGTLIQFVDYLKKVNSPPVDIHITVDGKSRVVTKVVDGWVKPLGGDDFTTPEDLATPGSCADEVDNDGDAKTDADDEGCQTQCRDFALYFGPAPMITPLAVGFGTSFVLSMQNEDAALGFQLGVKATAARGITTWELYGALGPDSNRLIELIITDFKGNSQTPEAGNTATSRRNTIGSIARGAAIAGFSNDDYFEVDLSPGAGGPGFTVGYVADLTPAPGGSNRIPPTEVGPCRVNEILKVDLGAEPRFSRGDANSDSKINVTDAVLIIQNIVRNIPQKFACDDILDANDDGRLTFVDALPVLAYVFRRGPDLPAPFRDCGTDPTPDALDCAQSSCQQGFGEPR